MQEKRAEWKKLTKEIPKEKLVFLDESGVNTNGNVIRAIGEKVFSIRRR